MCRLHPVKKSLRVPIPSYPLRLIVPMGRWYIEEDTAWLDHWDWFTSETTEFLFRQVGENVWRLHVEIVGTARSLHQQFLTLAARPVERLHQATIKEIRNAWVLTSTDSSTHKSLASGRLSYRTVIKLNVCNNRQCYPHFNFNPVSINSLLLRNVSGEQKIRK